MVARPAILASQDQYWLLSGVGSQIEGMDESLLCAQARTRFAGLVLWPSDSLAPKQFAAEASKVGALPQTPPGAEPLDLSTCRDSRSPALRRHV